VKVHVEDEIEDRREEKWRDIAGKTYLGGCGGKWRETCVGVYAATYLVLRALLFILNVVAARCRYLECKEILQDHAQVGTPLES